MRGREAMWEQKVTEKIKIEVMKKKILPVAVAVMVMVSLTSCGTSKKAQGSKSVKANMEATKTGRVVDEGFLVLTDEQRKMIEGSNEFALDLFCRVAGFDSKVISPMSVSYLMGMLANGADGETRQEILAAMGCKGVSLEQLNEFYAEMIRCVGNFDKTTTINIANYVALNKQYKLKAAFAQTMKEAYGAGIESLDFASPATAKHINQWCSKHTDGMIPSIIDSTDPDAVSYIMNAIYFNGMWSGKFDRSQTELENFQGYTRDIKKVQMMHRNAKYMYMDNDTFAAVGIPYGNGACKMTVLLPNPGKSIGEMLKSLDAKTLAELGGKMDNCIVDLKLPRFTTEIEQPLNEVIGKLGAPSMFTSGANFSNFADGNLFVSKMFQKAKIEVDEEGTKAAAVTAATMALSAFRPEEPRRVEFHADRPFVYMITEESTGAILFMGQFTGSEL